MKPIKTESMDELQVNGTSECSVPALHRHQQQQPQPQDVDFDLGLLIEDQPKQKHELLQPEPPDPEEEEEEEEEEEALIETEMDLVETPTANLAVNVPSEQTQQQDTVDGSSSCTTPTPTSKPMAVDSGATASLSRNESISNPVVCDQKSQAGGSALSDRPFGISPRPSPAAQSQCEKQCRQFERQCNQLKDSLCSSQHLVLVLDNIRRLSRDYINSLYQLLGATLRSETNFRIDQLQQDTAELESELAHWERKYQLLSQFNIASSSGGSNSGSRIQSIYSSPVNSRSSAKNNNSFDTDIAAGARATDLDDSSLDVAPSISSIVDLAQLIRLEQGRRQQQSRHSNGSNIVHRQQQQQQHSQSSYSHNNVVPAGEFTMLPSELCEMSMEESLNEPNGPNSGFGPSQASLLLGHSTEPDDSADPDDLDEDEVDDDDDDEESAYAHYEDEIRQLQQSQHQQTRGLVNSSRDQSLGLVRQPPTPGNCSTSSSSSTCRSMSNADQQQSHQQSGHRSFTGSHQSVGQLSRAVASPCSSSSKASSCQLGRSQAPVSSKDSALYGLLEPSLDDSNHQNNSSQPSSHSQSLVSAAVAAVATQHHLKLSQSLSEPETSTATATAGCSTVSMASFPSSKPVFRCDHSGCQYQTTMRQRLAMHRRIHAGEMLYSCDIAGCGYQSNYKGNIKIHKKHRHRIDPGCQQSSSYIVNHLQRPPNNNNNNNNSSNSNTTTKKATDPVSQLAQMQMALDSRRKRKRLSSEMPQLNSRQHQQPHFVPVTAEDSLEGGGGSGPDLTITATTTSANRFMNLVSSGLSCDDGGGATAVVGNGNNGHYGSGESQFVCRFPGCNYRSKWKQCLTAHQFLHAGVKPFKCDFAGCNYRTNFKGNVNVHKRVHRASQFRCKFPGCHFSTPWKNSFLIHQRNHQTASGSSPATTAEPIAESTSPASPSTAAQKPMAAATGLSTPPLLRAIEQNLLSGQKRFKSETNNSGLQRGPRTRSSATMDLVQQSQLLNDLIQYRLDSRANNSSSGQSQAGIDEDSKLQIAGPYTRQQQPLQQPPDNLDQSSFDQAGPDDTGDIDYQQSPTQEDPAEEDDEQLINEDDEDDDDEDRMEHYWDSVPGAHRSENSIGLGSDFVDFDSEL